VENDNIRNDIQKSIRKMKEVFEEVTKKVCEDYLVYNDSQDKIQEFLDYMALHYGATMDACIKIMNQVDVSFFQNAVDVLNEVSRKMRNDAIFGSMDRLDGLFKGHCVYGLYYKHGRLADKVVCGEYRRQYDKPVHTFRVRYTWMPKQVDIKRRMMPPHKRWPEVKVYS
jgi:hypothetical protein